MKASSKILWVFWIEGIANLPAALVCLVAPSLFLSGLVQDYPFDALHLAFTRWYGVLLLVLSLALIGCLRYGDRTILRVVLTAFLLGDILQILVSLQLGVAFGWSPGVWGALGSSLVYLVCRLWYLRSRH